MAETTKLTSALRSGSSIPSISTPFFISPLPKAKLVEMSISLLTNACFIEVIVRKSPKSSGDAPKMLITRLLFLSDLSELC